MKLLILGAGGYGKIVKEIAESCGYNNIAFLDDNCPWAVGRLEELEKIEGGYDGSIVAIGNPKIKEQFFHRVKKPVNVIHPTAVVSKSSSIGMGCVIEASAVINTEAVIGNGVFVCAGAVVNHNSVVGEFCQVDCNAVVAMGAEVPKGYKIESCSVFKKA